jgi:aminoglycoside phosphotransferase family enzyme
MILPSATPNLADKVAFLGRPATFGGAAVTCRETHMSYVFLAGDRVYKLKKPVRFPYLDFTTIERREAACKAELALNRRLAPDIYLDVVPLVYAAGQFAIGGKGPVVDWLVVMRRLDESTTLEHAITAGTLEIRQIERVSDVLYRFYRHAARVPLSPETYLADWHASLNYNYRVLLDPRFDLPHGLIRRVQHAQRVFLVRHAELLLKRVRERRVVDAHGDLRPEHIFIDDRVRIIDALEFSARLRANDPFDEISFLGVECERLGARWAGNLVKARLAHALADEVPDAVFAFYRCHRATLRARLAIAHLLEPTPRTPEKWPRLARRYLSIAARDARNLMTARTR